METKSEPTNHVFEGKPTDGRQASPSEGPIKVTRFRPRYRNLGPGEKDLHDEIKLTAERLEALIETIHKVSTTVASPDRPVAFGRYKALALTALEESVMWAVKELTA